VSRPAGLPAPAGLAAAWGRARPVLVLLRRVAMVALLVAMFLRPAVGEAEVPLVQADLEVLVVLDRTKSMDAEDYDGDERRLVGARQDLVQLTRDLPGARFAMLTFGDDTRLELPFTTDTTAFGSLVETVRTENPFSATGSLVDRPLEDMDEILTRAAEADPDRRRLVVFVSDGENTADGEQASFAPLAELVDGGVVLGYGTEEGGPMRYDPEDDDDLGQDFIPDTETYEDARSRIDEANLQAIAEQMGVGYVHRDAPDEAGIRALADSFASKPVPDPDAPDDLPADLELTWVLAGALLVLGALELRSSWRGLLGARRAGAGR